LESLTADQAKEIVLRHVVTAKVPAAAVTTGDVATIGGELIGLVKTPQGGVQINYKGGVSNVVTADVQASNGVIHVIDSVILPAPAPARSAPVGDVVDVAVGAGSFKTLVKIVSDLGLVDTLKNAEALTVFAPSDDAFAKLPAGTLESLTADQAKEIVLRHVVTAKVPAAAVTTGDVATIGGELIGLVKTPQGGVQINYKGGASNVVTADVQASNGVIHVIDNVILPAPAPKAAAPVGDVVDVAVGAGSFKTLVKIVSDLGLVDTLKAAKEVTIFAPSDAAFAKLPAGTLESLTADQAKAIVLRHVVAAKVPASVVVSGNVRTFGNEMIELIKTAQGGVQIRYNGGVSNVVAADVNASNGIIHVIDKVIL